MSLEYVTPDKGPGAPLNLEFWTYFFFGEGPKGQDSQLPKFQLRTGQVGFRTILQKYPFRGNMIIFQVIFFSRKILTNFLSNLPACRSALARMTFWWT